ncbi:MAG: hypothetical protein MJ193_04035, partial [Clostridia bacterium]|nr:hypothetical protein [Clostridia bacterium]
AKRLDDKDVTITITEKAKEFIVSKGFDEEYGARPLRRTIQRLIEDKLSEQILSGEIGSGDNLKIDEENGELIFSKI